jgi:hypothetical protein
MDVVARHQHMFPDPLIILQCLVCDTSLPKRKEEDEEKKTKFHADLLPYAGGLLRTPTA